MTIGNTAPSEVLSTRIAWMDISRGLAIILVIVFHSVSEVDKQFDLPDLVVNVNNIVAPARMPLMVFLSGMLMGKSIRRKFSDYSARKIMRILWPYFLWTVFMLLILSVAGGAHRINMQVLLSAFTVSPIDHMWFLRDLFLFYMLSFAVQALSKPILLMSLGLALVVSEFYANDQVVRFVYLYFFFVLGWALSGNKKRLESIIKSNAIILCCMLSASLLIPTVLLLGDVRYEIVFLPLVMSFAALVMRMSMFLEGRFVFLEVLGRNSLIFYLVHWPVILIVASGALSLVPGANSILVSLICFVTAFLICFVVTMYCRATSPLGFLFVFPQKTLTISKL